MAESNFIYYRGFPMVRSGNVMVQMIPTSPTPEDLAKIRKGEMNSLNEALDTAHVWLTKELFGA